MEVRGCPLPEDRLYDLEEGSWYLAPEEGGLATIGVTATFGGFVGRFTAVRFLDRPGPIERGRGVAAWESVRAMGPFRAPVDGEIVERNPAVIARPKLLNDDPFGAGWIARMRPMPGRALPGALERAGAIAERLAARIDRDRIRCYPAAPDAEMYEVGAECQAILVRLDEELAHRAPGEVILLVTDDPTSPIEMVRWQDRSGHGVIHHRVEGSLHHFLVRRVADPRPARPRT